MFNTGGPQTGNEFTTSAVNQQNNQLLGNPQTGAMPTVDPMMFNTTAPGSSPGVASLIKALKG